MVLSAAQVDSYLARIAVHERPAADASALRVLQRAHLRNVPFENLDIHLGMPIVLDPLRLHDKVVGHGRGGFCYELNGLFGALLASLGYSVAYLEARVYEEREVGIRFDHLCLLVDAPDAYLVDVGFGDCFDEPLRFHGEVQHDAVGDFEIVDRGDGWHDLLRDSEPQYRFSTRPRRLADFEDGCHFHQTSPASHFTHNPVCSIRTESGRVTLRGSLLVETENDERKERQVDETEVATTYATRFGIHLDAVQLESLLGDSGVESRPF